MIRAEIFNDEAHSTTSSCSHADVSIIALQFQHSVEYFDDVDGRDSAGRQILRATRNNGAQRIESSDTHRII